MLTLNDIDKQFDERFQCGYVGCNCADGIGSIVGVKDFIHQIYFQAKAEQGEDWIGKIEKMDSQIYQMTDSIKNPETQSLELIKKTDIIQSLKEEVKYMANFAKELKKLAKLAESSTEREVILGVK